MAIDGYYRIFPTPWFFVGQLCFLLLAERQANVAFATVHPYTTTECFPLFEDVPEPKATGMPC